MIKAPASEKRLRQMGGQRRKRRHASGWEREKRLVWTTLVSFVRLSYANSAYTFSSSWGRAAGTPCGPSNTFPVQTLSPGRVLDSGLSCAHPHPAG